MTISDTDIRLLKYYSYDTLYWRVFCCVRGCSSNDIDFMSLRFWVGLWLAVILLIIVAFDLSFMVRYITRFTEESFAVLISIIFIYEAFTKVIAIYGTYSVARGYEPGRHNVGPCFCVQPTLDQMSLNQSAYNMTALLASGKRNNNNNNMKYFVYANSSKNRVQQESINGYGLKANSQLSHKNKSLWVVMYVEE